MRASLAPVVVACGVVASIATSQLALGVGDSTQSDAFALAAGASATYELAIEGKTSAPLSTADDARTLRVTVHLHGVDATEPAPDGQVLRATLTRGTGDPPLVDEELPAADGELDIVVPFAEDCAADACTIDEVLVLVVARVDEGAEDAHGYVTATVHAAYDESVQDAPADDAIDLALTPQ